MDLAHVLALMDRHQRIELLERGCHREVAPEAVRQIHQGQGTGMVIYSRLTEENADRVIGEQIAAFRALDQDFEWKLYGHDTPSNLKDRLLTRGFTAEDAESVMVLEVENAPAELLRPPACDIRRVVAPAQLAGIGRIHESVWSSVDPEYVAARTAHYLAALTDNLIHDPERESVYLAYSVGIPVSYARITFQEEDPFAGLWGGSTLEAHRRKGFYTALLAARLQEAKRRGVRFLTLDASAMSRPIVERHGFQFVTTTQPFQWRHSPGQRMRCPGNTDD